MRRARSARSSGCRAARSRPNTPSPCRARAARRRPRAAPGRSRACAPAAHADARGSHGVAAADARCRRRPRRSDRRSEAGSQQAFMRSPSSATMPASRPARLHRRDEHLGAVRVVAEHVEAGAGRRQQHGVAGLRACAAAARRRFERRAALDSATPVAVEHRARSAARRGRSAAPRARGARPARPAARSPGPCRRRRAISTSLRRSARRGR